MIRRKRRLQLVLELGFDITGGRSTSLCVPFPWMVGYRQWQRIEGMKGIWKEGDAGPGGHVPGHQPGPSAQQRDNESWVTGATARI